MAHEFPQQHNGFLYRMATGDDTEAVKKLLVDEFFVHMPVFKYAEVKPDMELLDMFLRPNLEEGVSILAIDEASNEIIGARLSSIERKDGDNLKLEPPSKENAERYKKNYQFLSLVKQLEDSIDYYERYGVTEFIMYRALMVKKSHGGRGVGRKLHELSLELAKNMQFRLAVGNTESAFSEKIYRALGFEQLDSIRFKDWEDPNNPGEKPFAVMETTQHKEAVLFGKSW